MLDLNDIKLAVFDFDDTLCIRKRHNPVSRQDMYEEALSLGISSFDDCDYSRHMLMFIKMLEDKEISLGLMSWCEYFSLMKDKAEWVHRSYGVEMENYCVGARECKVVMLKALSRVKHIRESQILLVDDNYSTLEEVAKEGFQCATPMEVVEFIEDVRDKA